MSIKGNWRRHGSEVVIRWCQRFFSRRFATQLRRSVLSPLTRKKPLAPSVTKTFMLLQVNSIEKWTEIKNTGLKIPEKDQIISKLDFHTISELKL